MKSFIVSAVLVCALMVTTSAAHNRSYIKTDSTNQSSLSRLLNLYYNIKDALVNSDDSSAASSAGEFVKAIKDIDVKNFSGDEHNIFISLQEKIIYDATGISESKDLSKQRNSFASLSDNLYSLAKTVKLSIQPIYKDYCPMKKKYWLSSESTIKNPYYGKAMLTCGKVTETLK